MTEAAAELAARSRRVLNVQAGGHCPVVSARRIRTFSGVIGSFATAASAAF